VEGVNRRFSEREVSWRRQVRQCFFCERANYKKTALLTELYARRGDFMYSNNQQWNEKQ